MFMGYVSLGEGIVTQKFLATAKAMMHTWKDVPGVLLTSFNINPEVSREKNLALLSMKYCYFNRIPL